MALTRQQSVVAKEMTMELPQICIAKQAALRASLDTPKAALNLGQSNGNVAGPVPNAGRSTDANGGR
jgi:hypothetical protein